MQTSVDEIPSFSTNSCPKRNFEDISNQATLIAVSFLDLHFVVKILVCEICH